MFIFLKDVENVRATSGYPLAPSHSGSNLDPPGSQQQVKLKPILPPKPSVPCKPTPPPRQKGDPMASSTESINLSGLSTHQLPHRPQNVSNRPQVFR